MQKRLFLAAAVLLAGAFSGNAQAPQKQIAILSSQNSRIFFERHYPTCGGTNTLGPNEFDRYLLGWEHVLDNAFPYRIIYDADVTDSGLARYGVLILPNTVSLSDDQAKAIHHWVLKGGRLIATFGSGYKDIVSDPRQADGLKPQNGGTGALHSLWHDPLSKVFSTNALGASVPYIRLTQPGVPPTAGLVGLIGDLLPYGALGNMLIQRPEGKDDVFGVLVLDPPVAKHSQPAIIVDKAAQGLVAYFAFAPEFLVALEYGLPRMCDGFSTAPWQGRSAAGASLMRSTVLYMLQH